LVTFFFQEKKVTKYNKSNLLLKNKESNWKCSKDAMKTELRNERGNESPTGVTKAGP
jgi:hypothetical protein